MSFSKHKADFEQLNKIDKYKMLVRATHFLEKGTKVERIGDYFHRRHSFVNVECSIWSDEVEVDNWNEENIAVFIYPEGEERIEMVVSREAFDLWIKGEVG